MTRKRHKTKYPGIYYRLVDESRPDGPRKYVVWYSDINGNGHTETLPLGATLEDARLRQGELKRKKSEGETLIKTKLTVGEYLDIWLEKRKLSLEPASVRVYTWSIEVLKDKLGRRKLREITASDIATLRAELAAKGMKKHSIAKIETPLSSALRMASRDGLIAVSPYTKLLPHERVKADQKEMRCLNRGEIEKLLKHSGDSRTLHSFLILTGLRISEALALTWADVDFANNCIHVRGGKTAAAKRDVMLIEATAASLRRLKLSQAPGVQQVFPMAYRTCAWRLKKACEKAGIPAYSLHELRHTYASILIAQGELPTLVAAQMGHKDPGITLKTYTHLFEKQESVTRASERLQKAFGGMV